MKHFRAQVLFADLNKVDLSGYRGFHQAQDV
jgi:hypothetical protein